MKPIRFGILATGRIAERVAPVIQSSAGCELIAAASRSADSATTFAAKFAIEGIIGYEALLARKDIDAVYLATPHPQHFEWCLRAIENGKHVLCEKPLTMTVREAENISQASQKHQVLVTEAFMFRFHPQTKTLVELIRSGVIGELKWINADFGFVSEYHPESRIFSKALGGGGILDVGCYTAAMARLIAGAASNLPFLNPVSVKAVGKLNEVEQTDWLAGALLSFPGDMLATLRCGTRFNVGQTVRIEGTKGILEMNSPWIAGNGGAWIKVISEDGEEIISTENEADLYSFMIAEFARTCREGRPDCESIQLADSLGNMGVLEEWLAQVGVSY